MKTVPAKKLCCVKEFTRQHRSHQSPSFVENTFDFLVNACNVNLDVRNRSLACVQNRCANRDPGKTDPAEIAEAFSRARGLEVITR